MGPLPALPDAARFFDFAIELTSYCVAAKDAIGRPIQLAATFHGWKKNAIGKLQNLVNKIVDFDLPVFHRESPTKNIRASPIDIRNFSRSRPPIKVSDIHRPSPMADWLVS
jgi:hypothetical protein